MSEAVARPEHAEQFPGDLITTMGGVQPQVPWKEGWSLLVGLNPAIGAALAVHDSIIHYLPDAFSDGRDEVAVPPTVMCFYDPTKIKLNENNVAVLVRQQLGEDFKDYNVIPVALTPEILETSGPGRRKVAVIRNLTIGNAGRNLGSLRYLRRILIVEGTDQVTTLNNINNRELFYVGDYAGAGGTGANERAGQRLSGLGAADGADGLRLQGEGE